MTITATTIARKFGVTRKTIYDWAKDGCPRNTDGSFDADKVLAWRKAKLQAAADDPAVKIQQNKTALQAKRLLHQCELLELQILKERGKLHDKDACAASLAEARAAESHILHGIGDALAAQFPELGGRVKEAADKIVDEVIERLKG